MTTITKQHKKKGFFHQLTLVAHLIGDASRLFVPRQVAARMPYRFAFLVHPRHRGDMYRKLPFLRYLPESWVRWFEYHWFPAVVSPIKGLKNADGKPIDGYVISIPMTAPLMMQHREQALRQIRKAVRLARNRGARIVGLGALTSSLTRGGLDLIDIPGVAVTTGHAYTGFTVSQTMLSLIRKSGVPLSEARVAIVGAAGSIGGITAKLLAREGVRTLDLIDLPRKRDRVDHLIETLQTEHEGHFRYHDSLHVLKNTPFIVTATNAAGALVEKHHLAAGTIIVDDAQPSDVAPDVFEDADVLVAAAGAVFTPNIKSHFPMGLAGEDDNYCCLAELLVLAHQERREHFVLDKPTVAMVDIVAETGKSLGFKVAKYQNEYGHIAESKLQHVLQLVKKRS